MAERPHDPGTDPEDEGIPELWSETPAGPDEPELMPVPGDEPAGVDEFGTTADEEREGESLDDRLDRERADPAMSADPGASAGVATTAAEPEDPHRLTEPDVGASPDTENTAVARDEGHDGGGFSAEERSMRVEDEDALDGMPQDEASERPPGA
jgi:hypothetical protein